MIDENLTIYIYTFLITLFVIWLAFLVVLILFKIYKEK